MSAIEINDVGNICISGELSFATVPELNRRGCEFIKQNASLVFDLDKVTLSDNTGVALLVAWARCAKRMSKKISFINLPQQLLDLVKASGLGEILRVE
ncbi:MAG: hypothetical protein ACD_21C00284G0022 [uncultured bacterium]|nr:MAG: hypothetical protein ACD_21C00284G0022 [uncultured bacterium]